MVHVHQKLYHVHVVTFSRAVVLRVSRDMSVLQNGVGNQDSERTGAWLFEQKRKTLQRDR